MTTLSLKFVPAVRYRSLVLTVLVCTVCGSNHFLMAQSTLPLSYKVTELLVSSVPADRAEGENLASKHRNEIIASLLADIRSRDRDRVGVGAYELVLMISPWARVRDASSRFVEFTSIYSFTRPVERPNNIPEADSIRKTLQEAISWMCQAKVDGASYWIGEMEVATSTLAEVANDETVDWALDKLERIKSDHDAQSLMAMCESYLGLPHTFLAGMICGNSSEAEMKRFAADQALILSKSVDKIRAQWEILRTLPVGQRAEHSIKAWRDKIIPRMRSYSGSYFHEGWLSAEFEPLIRLGTAALQALKAQRDAQNDLGERAVWDYFIAAISGVTDVETVRQMLNGSDTQRDMACEIIAVSGELKWMTELEQLSLVNGYHMGKASKVLAACHGDAAIPSLQRVFQLFPKEPDTRYVKAELKARIERGPPPRRAWQRR